MLGCVGLRLLLIVAAKLLFNEAVLASVGYQVLNDEFTLLEPFDIGHSVATLDALNLKVAGLLADLFEEVAGVLVPRFIVSTAEGVFQARFSVLVDVVASIIIPLCVISGAFAIEAILASSAAAKVFDRELLCSHFALRKPRLACVEICSVGLVDRLVALEALAPVRLNGSAPTSSSF